MPTRSPLGVPGDEDIADEALRLDSLATQGPWTCKSGIHKHYVFSSNEDLGFSLQEYHPLNGRRVPAKDNARLMARYRTLAPELARELQRLRIEVAHLRIEVAQLKETLRSVAESRGRKQVAGALKLGFGAREAVLREQYVREQWKHEGLPTEYWEAYRSGFETGLQTVKGEG